jgi:hypothetical protein
MSIAAGIAATKATLDVAKLLSDLVKRPNIDPADVQAKLHELLIHAVNAQSALGDAQVEMNELRRQLDDREELKVLKADLEFVLDGHFYVKKSKKEKGLIPYCPLCWKEKGKDIHLTILDAPGGFTCSIHNTVYATKAHQVLKERQAVEEEIAWKAHNEISPL